jgi:hypothetical protein
MLKMGPSIKLPHGGLSQIIKEVRPTALVLVIYLMRRVPT